MTTTITGYKNGPRGESQPVVTYDDDLIPAPIMNYGQARAAVATAHRLRFAPIALFAAAILATAIVEGLL